MGNLRNQMSLLCPATIAQESDFDSFNSEQAIAEILLDLTENFKTSAAATCFVNEKVKYILGIDNRFV